MQKKVSEEMKIFAKKNIERKIDLLFFHFTGIYLYIYNNSSINLKKYYYGSIESY